MKKLSYNQKVGFASALFLAGVIAIIIYAVATGKIYNLSSIGF